MVKLPLADSLDKANINTATCNDSVGGGRDEQETIIKGMTYGTGLHLVLIHVVSDDKRTKLSS